MKRIILFLFLICSANLIFASTASETIFNKSNNFEEIQNSSHFYSRSMTIIMKDECGISWTITASCESCSNYVLNQRIMNYFHENLDSDGCFHKPAEPEIPGV